MNNTTKKKTSTRKQPAEPQRVGEDGRLYFHYNEGAKYICERVTYISASSAPEATDEGAEPETKRHGRKNEKPQFERLIYEIYSCFYQGGKEHYLVKCYDELLPHSYTLDRLNYLIQFSLIEQLDEGTPCELPLLEDEVKTYYAAVAAARRKGQSELKKELKDVKGYAELEKSKTEKVKALAQAHARHEETETARKELEAVQLSINELAIQNGIALPTYANNDDILNCPRCQGKGLLADGGICSCTEGREEAIKTYCAAKRLEKLLPEKIQAALAAAKAV